MSELMNEWITGGWQFEENYKKWMFGHIKYKKNKRYP